MFPHVVNGSRTCGVVEMGRIGLAFRVFFAVLFRASAAQAVRQVLVSPTPAAEAPPTKASQSAPPPAPPKPARSEALTLLAALQREGRLVDFLKEPIASYTDAQIGAAVREVHRGCAGVLDRWFELRPVIDQPENSPVPLEKNTDAARIQLTGQASAGAAQGQLRHHGWEAARCELPQWTGSAAAARVVAPAEVEVG